jgi:hypothetical protein
VTKLHVSVQLRWRHLTYRHMGGSAMSQRRSEFLVATLHIKNSALNTVIGFLRFSAKEYPFKYNKKTSAIVCKVVTFRMVPLSIEPHPFPPLFWLDKIFYNTKNNKTLEQGASCLDKIKREKTMKR